MSRVVNRPAHLFYDPAFCLFGKKINITLPMPLTLWYKENDPAVLVMQQTRF